MSGRSEIVARFSEFASGESLDLWEGALLVALLVDPAEDLDVSRARVEGLVGKVRQAGRGQPRLEDLVRVLFAEEGFGGDADSYDDPANSSVARVLDKKTGLPITLSIVTIEVGRRTGLPLSGVGLPGHFVVGGAALPPGRFLDPFDGGRLADVAELTRRVSSIFGSPVSLSPDAFAPDSSRAVLLRALFNLRRSWERCDRFEEALDALSCAEALAPGDATMLRERGLLLLRAGRAAEALVLLESYMQVAEEDDAEAISKLVKIVREGGASHERDAGNGEASRRVFTLEQAREMLPRIREITSRAVAQYARITPGDDGEQERQGVVHEWVREVASFGAEIKGLWLVDFDSGAGYYCWKYPEPGLEYFHGYEEGFAGRLPLQ